MSQYNIKSTNPLHTITVGWDKPLDSYFATVITEKDNVEEVVLLSLNAQRSTATVAVSCFSCWRIYRGSIAGQNFALTLERPRQSSVLIASIT